MRRMSFTGRLKDPKVHKRFADVRIGQPVKSLPARGIRGHIEVKPRALRLKRGRFTSGIPSRPADSRLRGLCFCLNPEAFSLEGVCGERSASAVVGMVEGVPVDLRTAEVDAAQAVQDLLPFPARTAQGRNPYP